MKERRRGKQISAWFNFKRAERIQRYLEQERAKDKDISEASILVSAVDEKMEREFATPRYTCRYKGECSFLSAAIEAMKEGVLIKECAACGHLFMEA
jgi:hypothetical protein